MTEDAGGVVVSTLFHNSDSERVREFFVVASALIAVGKAVAVTYVPSHIVDPGYSGGVRHVPAQVRLTALKQ